MGKTSKSKGSSDPKSTAANSTQNNNNNNNNNVALGENGIEVNPYVQLAAVFRETLDESFGGDTAIFQMAVGALYKFIELVILRNNYSVVRWLFSIFGGVHIATGAGLMARLTIMQILAHNDKTKKGKRSDAAGKKTRKVIANTKC